MGNGPENNPLVAKLSRFMRLSEKDVGALDALWRCLKQERFGAGVSLRPRSAAEAFFVAHRPRVESLSIPARTHRLPVNLISDADPQGRVAVMLCESLLHLYRTRRHLAGEGDGSYRWRRRIDPRGGRARSFQYS